MPRSSHKSPYEKRTSAAKAVERQTVFGTAEAVPFVSVFRRLRRRLRPGT